MKIVVAFDSFKGSAGAREVGDAVARAFKEVLAECEVVNVPVADGGEGSVEAVAHIYSGKVTRVECNTVDPLMRPIKANYIILGDGETAAIELATASGLPLVEPQLRNPLNTTTLGTGLIIKDALDRGCRRFVIWLGGSATNDGGMGLLTALGYRFLDVNNQELPPTGKSLPLLATIDGSRADKRLATCHFTAACDVRNPLTGPMGAAHIFAPQKGADARAVQYLDHGLARYAQVIHQFCGREISTLPGAGAAGGVGGGIAALLDAELKPGCEIILDLASFDNIITDADYIITGEGKIDAQSLMGKVVGTVLHRAASARVPVIGIAGAVDCNEVDDGQFAALLSIQQSPTTLEDAMQNSTTLRNVWFTARQAAKLIKSCRS